MRNLRFSFSIAIVILALFARTGRSSAPEYRVVDATGAESLFARPPTRIVPLLPSLAELVDRVGVPHEQIVGVSAYTDYPLDLKKKPSIGSYVKPNMEAIVALRPDLILASRDGTPRETVTRLRKLGFSVVTVATESIAELRESFPLVGAAVGRPEAGASALKEFDLSFGALRKRAQGRPARRVLIQVGDDPLVVAAGKTFLHEGLVAIGATNVYPESDQTYPRVSVEDVLKRDPEVIAVLDMSEDVGKSTRAGERWKKSPNKSGSALRRVVVISSDSLMRPGPRFLRGLEVLESAIFPSAPGSK